MVCGFIGINKNADSLCEIVQAKLQRNPFDGNVYAFYVENESVQIMVTAGVDTIGAVCKNRKNRKFSK